MERIRRLSRGPGRVIASALLVALVLCLAGRAHARWLLTGNPVCNAPGNAGVPEVVVVDGFPAQTSPGFRGALLCWSDPRGLPADGGDLYAGSLDDGSGAAEVNADGSPFIVAPGIQRDPKGAVTRTAECGFQGGCLTALLVWVDDPGSPGGSRVRARMQDSQIGGVTGWATSDVAVAPSLFAQSEPRVLLAPGARSALVCWLETHGTRTRLRAQRFRRDGTPVWGASGIAVVADTTGQSHARMVSDGREGAYLVWAGAFDGDSAGVYVQRTDSTGVAAAGWPAGGILVARSALAQPNPEIVDSPAGGCFLVWEDDGAPGKHVRPMLQHLLGDGSLAPGWALGGVAAAQRTAGSLRITDAQVDGTGGVLLALTYEGPFDRDVVVQRVNVDASRPGGWPATGIDACAVPGDQYDARLFAQSGGLFVTWTDERDSPANADIRALRLLADGTRPPGWPLNGLGICTVAGRQYSPQVVPNDLGGAFVIWLDERNLATTGVDLYAQTVTDDGRLDAPPLAVGSRVELAAPSPNPSLSTTSIAFTLPREGPARVSIHDAAGRRVRTLHDGLLTAGRHGFGWDGRADDGRSSAPGVYFVRLRTAEGTASRPLVRIR